jgi:predicted acylesterase/phospholipase RssA
MRIIMSDFSVLCLNGGGVRGALQVGALKAFSEKIKNKRLWEIFIDGVYGISIGSILCSLIAFKYDTDEIEDLTKDLMNFSNFIEPLRLESIFELKTHLGFDMGGRVYNVLNTIFSKKGYNFKELKIGDAEIPLHIVASDITNCKSIIFNENVKLWDAIRASISIPIVFTPHRINRRLFVDGAILCKNIVKEVPLSQRSKMIALLCDGSKLLDSSDITLNQYMSALLHAPSQIETKWSEANYPKNVCLLTEPSVDVLDFGADISELIVIGYRLFGSKGIC